MAEEKFIRVTDDIYLSGDRYNYILNKKVTEKSGTISYRPYAYYGRIEALYRGIINYEIAADVELLQNIKKVTELMNSISENLKTAVLKVDAMKNSEKGFFDDGLDEESNEDNEEEDDI